VDHLGDCLLFKIGIRYEQLNSKWFGWWYVTIGIGFAMLALRNYFAGAGAFAISLRSILAAGFVVLGITTLRGRR
jgi:fructose-specific phosphotransferase system IIC component